MPAPFATLRMRQWVDSTRGTGIHLTPKQSSVLFVFFVVFIDQAGESLVLPILSRCAHDFDEPISKVGLLFSSTAGAMALSNLWLPMCADRYGRKAALIISLVGSTVGYLGQALAPSFGALLAFRTLQGFFGGVPPVLFAGFLLANLIVWQCAIVAVNLSHHRFYSHRSFATSRPVAFGQGVLGCAATQRGPLWWSSNHRRHHKFCETALDPHCTALQGFLYSHCGWICDRANFPIRPEYCGDWIDRPELLLLDANVEVISMPLRKLLTTAVLRLGVWLAAVVDSRERLGQFHDAGHQPAIIAAALPAVAWGAPPREQAPRAAPQHLDGRGL